MSNQKERESERLGISSTQAKGENMSTTSVGEGEFLVSQGGTLMQEQRGAERNIGIGKVMSLMLLNFLVLWLHIKL